jgi:hypothetical protein
MHALDAALAVPGRRAEILPSGAARDAFEVVARFAHRGYNEISTFEGSDCVTRIDDFRQRLVPEDEMVAALGRRPKSKRAKVAVGAADPDFQHPKLDVSRSRNRRHGMLDQPHFALVRKDGNCPHSLFSAHYHRIDFVPRGNRSAKLTITIDREVHKKVLAAAAGERMSISAWMTRAVREALRRRDGLAAVAEWEKQHGAFSAEEMSEARQRVQEQLRMSRKVRRPAWAPSFTTPAVLVAADRNGRRAICASGRSG